MLNPIVRSTAKILRRNYTMKICNKTAATAKKASFVMNQDRLDNYINQL